MSALLDVPLVSPADAARLSASSFSAPWRLRLAYVGPNATNASGESAKFWQITHEAAGRPDVEIRWGRLGTAGQSQRGPAPDAVRRAQEKLRKGYAADATATARPVGPGGGAASNRTAPSRAAAAPEALPLRERIGRASWRALANEDALFTAAGSLGWVRFELPEIPDGHRLYLGRGGNTLFVLRLDPLAFAALS